MKYILSLSLLLLLAAVTAVPRSPVVVEELDTADVPAEPLQDSWSLTESLDQVPSTLQDDEEEEDFDDDDDDDDEEEDSSREVKKFRVDDENDSYEDDDDDENDFKSLPSTGSGESFKETRRRLIEDYISLEHDLQLIRRLLGLTPNTDTIGHSSFGLWDVPGSEKRTEDEDHPAFGFGFNPPIFPNFPGLPIEPSLTKVDDLPDNYDNSTHEIHVVNGSRVEVNTTTNKESGDGFQSFFHDEVIAIRPVDDKDNTTGTQIEEMIGEEEPVKDEQLPPLPEVENEADKSGKSSSTLPEVDPKVEDDTVTTTEVSSISP
nr:protein dopey homolog PFC0245c-like [Cherax quadricarinatus]